MHPEIVPNTQKKKKSMPAKCTQMHPLVKVWILSKRKKTSVSYNFIYIVNCLKEGYLF